jgi:transcriptional regulator with XRE-family HTH domain
MDKRTALSDDCAVTQNEEPNIKQRFGQAVRRRRRELDLTQEELAERASVHRSYIANIERGEINPALENIEKIAEALEISIPDLFTNYGGL